MLLQMHNADSFRFVTTPLNHLIECKKHGRVGFGIACIHICRAIDSGEQVGFYWGSQHERLARPDAWCAACEDSLRQHENAAAEELKTVMDHQFLCERCWDEAKANLYDQHQGRPLCPPATEKRYSYRLPVAWLCGVSVVIGITVAVCCPFLRDPHGQHMPFQLAGTFGLLAIGLWLGFALTLRVLKRPYLILRDDALLLPGRPKDGWRIAYADIKEVRVHPPALGCRQIAIRTSERWRSISERLLPSNAAFDEVCAYIGSHVDSQLNQILEGDPQ
jgi:hypothetical protein